MHFLVTAFRRRLALQLEIVALCHQLAVSTVEKYRIRAEGCPSPTWKAFLDNHVKELVSIDFFVVPTAKFQILFVLTVLAHERRRIVYFNVTAHPTAQWTGQQIVEAVPFDTAPKYLNRDRDDINSKRFRRRVRNLEIEQVITAPRSSWQNPYGERFIGTPR